MEVGWKGQGELGKAGLWLSYANFKASWHIHLNHLRGGYEDTALNWKDTD